MQDQRKNEFCSVAVAELRTLQGLLACLSGFAAEQLELLRREKVVQCKELSRLHRTQRLSQQGQSLLTIFLRPVRLLDRLQGSALNGSQWQNGALIGALRELGCMPVETDAAGSGSREAGPLCRLQKNLHSLSCPQRRRGETCRNSTHCLVYNWKRSGGLTYEQVTLPAEETAPP